MQVYVEEIGSAVLLTIEGTVDSSTAPVFEEQLMAVMSPGCLIAVEMSGVDFMSSAGLRTMLMAYRQVDQNDGAIVLVAVPDDIQDAMDATGFLKNFTLANTVDEGLDILGA